MDLQRLCYARLGKVEKNAGYQLAARSEGIDGETTDFFGKKVSNVESISGSAAEGVFFGNETVFIARLVMNLDDMGRSATLSSALTLHGAAWRRLLRDYPSWRLTVEQKAFFDMPPEGAYPGHPAEVRPYAVPDEATRHLEAGQLLKNLGNGEKRIPFTESGISEEAFQALLRAVYMCLFATTDEPLFVSLPPETDRIRATRTLMAAVYAAMPSAFSSQLSYCSGARLSTQLVFGESSERKNYANYVDLFPSPENKSSAPVNCIEVAGAEYLNDMIPACLGENGSEILKKMDRFLDEFQLFEGDAVAPVAELRGKLQYALNAAWLSASGIAERHEPSYACFRPGSDTAARTMLTLAAHLKPGRQYPAIEPVLASLVNVYTDWPLHEIPSERGVKLQKEAVERVLSKARDVFPEWDSPFDAAYICYLAGSPKTPEGKKRFRSSVEALLESGSPRDVHALSRLLSNGSAVEAFSAADWFRLRDCFLNHAKEPAAEKASGELNIALHKAFRELPPSKRETIIREMVEANKDPALAAEFVKHQHDTLCFLGGDSVTSELSSIFHWLEQYPGYVKLLFVTEDGVISRQEPAVRKALYQDLLASESCTRELLLELLQTKPFAGLQDGDVSELLRLWAAKAESWKDCEALLSAKRVTALADTSYTDLLCTMLCNAKLAEVFKGGAKEQLDKPRTRALRADDRFRLFETYMKSCRIRNGREVLNTAAASGLSSDAYCILAQELIRRAELNQTQELLRDGSFYTRLSDDERYDLLRTALGKGEAFHSEFMALPLTASLSARNKVRLMEDYPEEGTILTVLSDSALQRELLTGKLRLGINTLKCCDDLYVRNADNSFSRFYEKYLREQRFDPKHSEAKQELAALAKTNKNVPEQFFRTLLREGNPGKERIGLADWFVNEYDLPSVSDNHQEMHGELDKLKKHHLTASASSYSKMIQTRLLDQLQNEADRKQFLRDAEEEFGDALDFTALRNKFWELFRIADIDLNDADFYEREMPEKESLRAIHEKVSIAARAYRNICEKSAPSQNGGRELYTLATEGKLSIDTGIGRLQKERREALLKELLAHARPMLDSAPGNLIYSSDLTALALFNGRTAPSRADVDKLVQWAKNADIDLRAKWREPPLMILANSKIKEYYGKALGRNLDGRIVRAAIVCTVLTAVIAVGVITIPPEVDAYQTWSLHHPEEKLTAFIQYRVDDKKNPLPEDVLTILSRDEYSKGYDFSHKNIDNTKLNQLVSKIRTAPESLDLSSNVIDNISILTTIPSLNDLRLGGNRVSDLSPISTLAKLENLDLSENPVSDLDPISALAGLKELNLRKTAVEDLSPLAGITGLHALNLSGNSVLRDLSGLKSLGNLVQLDLSDCSALEDIEAISGLPALQELRVNGTGISLRSLCIFAEENSNCAVCGADEKQIKVIHNTDGELYLPGNAVLNLSGERATDLGFLKEYPELFEDLLVLDLSYADIDDTQLEYVKAVTGNLRILILYGNPRLSQEAISELLKSAAEHGTELIALGVPNPLSEEENKNETGEEVHADNQEEMTALDLSGQEYVDLAAIAEKHPRALNLSYCKLKNLEGLEKMTELEWLNLSHCELADLTGLEALTNLKWLNLSYCNLTDLTGLEALKGLEWLNLSHNALTADHANKNSFYTLYSAKLDDLRWLNISFNPELDSIRDLRNYKNLEVLYATDLKDGEKAVSVATDSANLESLAFLSVSDRFDLEQVDKFFAGAKVLELRPNLEDRKYLAPVDATTVVAKLPQLASGCVVAVAGYVEEEPDSLENPNNEQKLPTEQIQKIFSKMLDSD